MTTGIRNINNSFEYIPKLQPKIWCMAHAWIPLKCSPYQYMHQIHVHSNMAYLCLPSITRKQKKMNNLRSISGMCSGWWMAQIYKWTTTATTAATATHTRKRKKKQHGSPKRPEMPKPNALYPIYAMRAYALRCVCHHENGNEKRMDKESHAENAFEYFFFFHKIKHGFRYVGCEVERDGCEAERDSWTVIVWKRGLYAVL